MLSRSIRKPNKTPRENKQKTQKQKSPKHKQKTNPTTKNKQTKKHTPQLNDVTGSSYE